MTEPNQPGGFPSARPRNISLSGTLPPWLARRLLVKDEEIAWVRGPRSNPPWERYVTHPGILIVALVLCVTCLLVGLLLSGVFSRDVSALFFAAAPVFLVGSVFVIGFSSGYFTRLVVTNLRVVIFQGYEKCRTWNIDELPPTLIRFRSMGADRMSRAIDLDALQSMLGTSSEQFADKKAIVALGKELDRIKVRKDV